MTRRARGMHDLAWPKCLSSYFLSRVLSNVLEANHAPNVSTPRKCFSLGMLDDNADILPLGNTCLRWPTCLSHIILFIKCRNLVFCVIPSIYVLTSYRYLDDNQWARNSTVYIELTRDPTDTRYFVFKMKPSVCCYLTELVFSFGRCSLAIWLRYIATLSYRILCVSFSTIYLRFRFN